MINGENFGLIDDDATHTYVEQGKEARRGLDRSIKQLLAQGRMPSTGWSDLWIKHILEEISLMDSNNFPDVCGVGEREGRIACPLVAQRHYYLGHGIGRSGDIAEVQPKAAGSSLLAKLANSFALHVIKMQGVRSASTCLLVPIATGMALVLTMLTLKEFRPKAKYVIWPRIDQKSCFKSILTSGLEPIIIENVLNNDHLETNVSKIKTAVANFGSESILCVMTTTSCFSPRIPDKLEDIALICKVNNIPHVVNNAYGIQSTKCMQLIQDAAEVGRVDAFIQSTDKNFMVPVGGAIIAGFDKQLVQSIGKIYPGRASVSPIVDFFVTMLSLGESGYSELLKERKEVFDYLKKGMHEIGGKYGERCMQTDQNEISLALTLDRLDVGSEAGMKNATEFGSYLFKRCVSGTRVVTPYDSKTIGKYTFSGWGAHHEDFFTSYLTAAASIGTTKADVDLFLKRLDKVFELFITDPKHLPPMVIMEPERPAPPPSVDIKHVDVSAASASDVNDLLAAKTRGENRTDLRPTKSMTEKRRVTDKTGLRPAKSMTEKTRLTDKTDIRPAKSMTEKTLVTDIDKTDLRPAKSMPEKTRPENKTDLLPKKTSTKRRRIPKQFELRPTKSMTERIRTRNKNKNNISMPRPRSFSSYDSKSNKNGFHDDVVDSSSDSSLSLASSVARIRDDVAQQLIKMADIKPDKMSFLIDI